MRFTKILKSKTLKPDKTDAQMNYKHELSNDKQINEMMEQLFGEMILHFKYG